MSTTVPNHNGAHLGAAGLAIMGGTGLPRESMMGTADSTTTKSTAASKPAPADAEWLKAARAVMEAEAEANADAAGRLNAEFLRAVEILSAHQGKVVLTGVGKSGNVARKIAGTLASTGTPSIYLHPTDALHGDLGIYAEGDPTILVSKSGATSELTRLIPLVRQLESPLIGILGHAGSPLARQLDVVLDASVRREADGQNLAPTSSTAVAVAIGDALAIAVMKARGFTAEDFQRRHPAGHLGTTLALRVADVMHTGDEVAWVSGSDTVKNVVVQMSRCPLGAACVVSPAGSLEGLITDGDLRRALEAHDDIRALPAEQIMKRKPVTITPEASLRDALRRMEDRPAQISVLPVVDSGGHCVGLLRLHDIYQAQTSR